MYNGLDILVLCTLCKVLKHEFNPKDDNGEAVSLGIELHSFSGKGKHPLNLESNMVYNLSKI